MADEQQHDKEADADLGDEPRIAIDGDGSTDAAEPHPPRTVAVEGFADEPYFPAAKAK